MAAGVLIAVAGLVVFAIAQRGSAGVSYDRLLGTPIGRALSGRAIAIGVAAGAVVVGSLVRRPSRVVWDVAGVAAAAALYVHAAYGHAAAGGLVVAKTLAQFVHMTAVGIWMGGLGALLVGMRNVDAESRLRSVRRYSSIAGFALLVVAVTGTERAIQEVRSWSGLFTTAYGRIVIAKVAGILVLAGLGAVNRYRNVSRAGEQPEALRRTARIELSTTVVILVLAALLASLVPAKSTLARDTSPRVIAEGSDFARNVSARLEIAPGRAGVNAFSLDLDVRRGPDVRGITMRLERVRTGGGDVEPTVVTFERDGDVWVARDSAVGLPGRWKATVTVDRGADSVEIPLRFHTACPAAVVQPADDLRLLTLDLGRGRSVQAYVDPAEAGNNEIHFTFFADTGKELTVSDDGVVTASRDGRSLSPDVRKLTPGHVVAGARLAPGHWEFDYQGEAKDGTALYACFEEDIR
jgi:putative copper export protein